MSIADFSEGVLGVIEILILYTIYTSSSLAAKNQLNIKCPLHAQHYG